MFNYKDMCKLLSEFANVSAQIGAYESPARPWKKKKIKKRKISATD